MGLIDKISDAFFNLVVFVWDNGLLVANLLTPKLKPGQVVPKGAPGHNLTWPKFVPPQDGDSRSACPMLNALANHGILPHDGKNITFKQLNTVVRQSFNFAPSFCFFTPKFAAGFLGRSYFHDTFDLADLNKHSDDAIEHDASLTRQDVALVQDQGKPDWGLVDQLLKEATGKMPDGSPQLTKTDLSRALRFVIGQSTDGWYYLKALSKRRAEASDTNKQYTESFWHNMFGSSNSSTMLTIFGGSIKDLTPMLKEERFEDHWEPRVLDRYGLTMAKFNLTVLPVEHGVDAAKYKKT